MKKLVNKLPALLLITLLLCFSMSSLAIAKPALYHMCVCSKYVVEPSTEIDREFVAKVRATVFKEQDLVENRAETAGFGDEALLLAEFILSRLPRAANSVVYMPRINDLIDQETDEERKRQLDDVLQAIARLTIGCQQTDQSEGLFGCTGKIYLEPGVE